MKKSQFASVIALLLCVFASVTCTEKSVIAPANNDTVLVSGQVLAWYCYIDYPYGFQPSDLRYAVATGDRPQIRFLYPDGEVIGFKSDSLSSFSRRLPKGRAKAIIETRRTWPDTVDCEFTADTSVIFKIRYDVIDADSISVQFVHSPGVESLQVAQEWSSIKWLTAELGGKISVGSTPDMGLRRTYTFDSVLFVYYSLPLVSGNYNIPAVIELANSFIQRDVYHEIYPTDMLTAAADEYVCLSSPPNP